MERDYSQELLESTNTLIDDKARTAEEKISKANIDNKRETIQVLGNKEYAFFDCGVQGQGVLSDPDNTKRYLSEDFYFCQLWKQCGGQIWADITSELKHIGIKTYERKPILKRHH